MEVVRIQNKVRLLFEKLLEPNYVMNNYYADGLVNKLASDRDSDNSCLANVPLLSDLIIESWSHAENAHISVKVFLTRILAVASRRELHFSKMFTKQGDNILIGFRQINSLEMNASLRVAFMEVALAIVEHNSGITWLLETGVWKEILSLCNEKRTVFVVRQTYKFASLFFWKLNDLADQTNLKIALDFILLPLNEFNLLSIENITSEHEERVAKTVEPMLLILESIISTQDRVKQSSILINMLIHDVQITPRISFNMDRSRKEEIMMISAKLLFWLNLAKLYSSRSAPPETTYKFDNILELGVQYLNTLQYFLQRRKALAVIDFCTSCSYILGTVVKEHDFIIPIHNDRQITLGHQMLFVCLVPLLVYVKQPDPNYPERQKKFTDESIHEYIVKLLNSACEHTARAAYAMRDLIWELDILPITLYSIKKLTCLKDHLDNDQANLLFQALFYVLQDYSPLDPFGENMPVQNYEDSNDKILVMTYVMDTVLSLVKHYNINWHKSLEIICLYNIVYSILQKPNLTTKFVVAALNVIALTVKKFLPPNLSLLMESKPGSCIHELGKLIFLKMHDMHWEVRDSALELLLVCTEISYIKFPSFQQQINENNLINVAATIAFNDYEPYVQVSALKCVGAASKVSNLWDHLKTEYPNMQDRLLSILRHNDEGMVRKEACNVLCEVYQNIKLTPASKQTFYDHMVSSALSDFHWEVQLSALKFWRIVFQSLLTDQGMLDGTFPPVTFSRETRKIVTLNETEIQKRLVKILDELATVGCLTVLVKLLHEDTEVEIMDNALKISLELLNIFNKYKVTSCLKPKPDELRNVDEFMSFIIKDEENGTDKAENAECLVVAENVIDGILNSDDLNLLTNIYNTQMNLDRETSDAPIKPKLKLVKFVPPFLFMNFLNSKDFKSIIEEKKKWNDGIRSLPSLLDDVLGIYEDNEEANSLDCY